MTMSFADEIRSGLTETEAFAGEQFSIAGRSELFIGVFRGESSPSSFDLQGFEQKQSNEVSVAISRFGGTPPLINQRLLTAAATYKITAVEHPDGVAYDLKLQRVDA
jgi:hypothetical protein